MHGGMQRLHPAVHHLGKSGELADVAHGKRGLAERLARAARGDELDAVAGERAGKLNEPGLVGNGDEGARDEAKLLGHDVRVSQPTWG